MTQGAVAPPSKSFAAVAVPSTITVKRAVCEPGGRGMTGGAAPR